MDRKRCSLCSVNKYIKDFNKDKSSKDGYSYWCKICKKFYMKNYGKINRENLRISHQNWINNNLDYVREKRKNYVKNKRQTDENYRILANLRSRLNKGLKLNIKSKRTKKLLGIPIHRWNELEQLWRSWVAHRSP